MRACLLYTLFISLILADIGPTLPPPSASNNPEPPQIKPKERRKYQKDDNSFSYSGLDNEVRTEEDEKDTIDYLTVWAEIVAKLTSPIFNLEVPASGALYFYEKIERVPQRLNGVYSVSESSMRSVMITITDPNNQVVLLKAAIRDLVFHPIVTIPGKYTIEIKNINVNIFPLLLVFCR